MADVSKIVLPDGSEYDIKDSIARTVVSRTADGLCPALPYETATTKYLRQDGTWVIPPNDCVKQMDSTANTTYNILLSATATSTSTVTSNVKKSTYLTYNPSTQKFVNSGLNYSRGKACMYGEYSATTAPSSPVTGQIWLRKADVTMEETKVLVLSSTLTSLPATISSSSITSDMEVIKHDFGTPSNVTSDISYETTTGSITLTGSIEGTTTIKLWLLRSRSGV